MSTHQNLTNQFLIAMPALLDPNFHRTVTLVCEHTDEGALGIIINRPLDLRVGEVFEQLSMDIADPLLTRQHVLNGGPVQQERGFVLHRPAHEWEATLRVSDSLGVTSSSDILSAMASGDGPDETLLALGYAGWGAGQLEQEMSANAWLSVPATPDIIFATPFESRWEGAARLLGFDPGHLSSEAGHA